MDVGHGFNLQNEIFTQLAVRPHWRLWPAIIAHLTATVGLRASRIGGASRSDVTERRRNQHNPGPPHPRRQSRIRFALAAGKEIYIGRGTAKEGVNISQRRPLRICSPGPAL